MNKYPLDKDGFVIYHELDEKKVNKILNKFRLKGLDLLMVSLSEYFWSKDIFVFGEKNLEGNSFRDILTDCFKKNNVPFLQEEYRCFYCES